MGATHKELYYVPISKIFQASTCYCDEHQYRAETAKITTFVVREPPLKHFCPVFCISCNVVWWYNNGNNNNNNTFFLIKDVIIKYVVHLNFYRFSLLKILSIPLWSDIMSFSKRNVKFNPLSGRSVVYLLHFCPRDPG